MICPTYRPKPCRGILGAGLAAGVWQISWAKWPEVVHRYRGAMMEPLEFTQVDVVARKQELRRELLQARKDRPADDRIDAQHANLAHLAAPLAEQNAVCAFWPLPSEPLTLDLLDLLVGFGVTVLVPVVTGASPLDWVEYSVGDRAAEQPGPLGIVAPSGTRLGPQAITEASAILVPALAIDHEGQRLGRGGGHYDRSLALLGELAADERPALIGVLFDDEFVDLLPAAELDVPVDYVVTPSRGFLALPR
jgi:5-formyltetrahydrofolate cyclo-ligase